MSGAGAADFGHGLGKVERKNSTHSMNSSRQGLGRNSSCSSLQVKNERERTEILKNRVDYAMLDENTDKGVKHKIKLKKEEIAAANAEFERIKDLLKVKQKATAKELNNWTL